MNLCSAVVVLQQDGSDMIFSKNQWYRVVIQITMDYTASAQGKVKAWVDDQATAAVDWTGKVGYTPTSQGGEADTGDAVSVQFGLYRHKSDPRVRQVVYYDSVKYASTQAEALPFTAQEAYVPPTEAPTEDKGWVDENPELLWGGGGGLVLVVGVVVAWKCCLANAAAKVQPTTVNVQPSTTG